MKSLILTIALLGLLAALGCGGTNSAAIPVDGLNPSLQSLDGKAVAGVSLSRTASGFLLRAQSIPEQGLYLSLSLPAGQTVASQNWSGAESLLTLMVPTAQGAEIGIAPIPGYQGTPVSVEARIGIGERRVSIPPVGADNSISDLVISGAAAGQVSLSWTERNFGDYDFNGVVSVNDLTPIGMSYQHTIPKVVDALNPAIKKDVEGAEFKTDWWVDGNHDGQITVQDLSIIGLNYGASVSKYRITHNVSDVIEVQRSAAIIRPGLPPTYAMQVPGSISDTWVVAPLDKNGLVGADSAGNTAEDLRVKLAIAGTDLFNLDGTGSGPFGPGRFSSRVIDPIDIVQRADPGNFVGTSTVLPDGTSTVVGGLPRSQRLYIDVRYAPTVNLATGAPRGTASLRNTSKNGGDDPPPSGGGDDGSDEHHDVEGLVDTASLVLSSIPIDMPATGAVDADVDIDLTADDGGGVGYFVDVTASVTYPGDDPATVPVETSYVVVIHKRLKFADGILFVDTNADGSFEDEIGYPDGDHDCLDDEGNLIDQQDKAFEDQGFVKVEVKEATAKFVSYNAAEGVMVLNVLDIIDGEEHSALVLGTHTFRVGAFTEYRNRTVDPETNLDPATLDLEAPLRVKLYFYTSADGTTLITEPVNSLRAEDVDLIVI